MQFMHHPGYMATGSALPSSLLLFTWNRALTQSRLIFIAALAGHGAAADGDDAVARRNSSFEPIRDPALLT